MTTNQMTHKQATTLAAFIHEIRGDWDKPGIEYALGKARDMAPGPDLAVAAIKAAKLATNRTPSIISMEGPHWRGSEAAPRYEQPDKAETCSTCYQRKDACRTRWATDHEFVSLQEVKRDRKPADERVRAELAAAIEKATMSDWTADNEDDLDDEEFCPKCYAGMESAEHFVKCDPA